MSNKESPDTAINETDICDSLKSVQTLLQNMQDKFQAMSEEIVHRMDEMGNRINDLEQNINDLMQQVDMENYEISSTSDPQNNTGQNKEETKTKETKEQ